MGKEIMCQSFGAKWLPWSPFVLTRFWNKAAFHIMREGIPFDEKKIFG